MISTCLRCAYIGRGEGSTLLCQLTSLYTVYCSLTLPSSFPRSNKHFNATINSVLWDCHIQYCLFFSITFLRVHKLTPRALFTHYLTLRVHQLLEVGKSEMLRWERLFAQCAVCLCESGATFLCAQRFNLCQITKYKDDMSSSPPWYSFAGIPWAAWHSGISFFGAKKTIRLSPRL
jgi:hypothetical protein